MPDIRPMLIRAIKDRPALWSSKHPHFKLKIFHKEYWQQVVTDLPASPKITVDTVKKQWKNLKDTYRKELKKPYQQWKFGDEMSFMKDDLRHVRRPGSPSGFCTNDSPLLADVEVSLSQDENNSKDSFEKTPTRNLLEIESFGWSPKKSPAQDEPFSESEQTVGETNPLYTSDFVENIVNKNNIRRSVSISQQDSSDYHFLMSILPEMEKLLPMQKMRLRNKIIAALMEEMSDSNQSQGTSTGGVEAKVN